MITPAFNLTATERVLPKLALNFITANIDPRITFTRSGNTATVVNSSGNIASINANLPRFDYDPVTLNCKGLLIEESRVNLMTYSQEFSTSFWTVQRANTSLDVTNSPSGIQNADKFYDDNTVSASHNISKSAGSLTGSHTFSIYVKKGERTWFVINAAQGGNFRTWFDVSNGAVGTVGSGCTASITNAGNDWFRCIVTRTLAGATTFEISLATANNVIAYSGDGVSGLFIWGAQLEAGSFATSYIPTEASQVTRTADVATMTGSNFSDWWYATEASVVVQATPIAITGTRPTIQFDDTTANELISLRGVSADPQLFIVDGGATQGTLDAGTLVANTAYNLGGAWKASNFAAAINGGAVVTQASGTLPTVTQARLGSDGSNYLSGHLQSIRYWTQRLINAEVQAFSK